MRKVEKIRMRCEVCDKDFYIYPSAITKSIKQNYKIRFCSRDCFYVWNKQRIEYMGGLALGKRWTHTDNYKKRLSLARTGEKNPMWINGSSRTRRQYGQKSRKWRKVVFKRDNNICQECEKKKEMLIGHHIKFWSKYPKLRFVVSNGVTLCVDCHKYVHRFERLWEKSLNKIYEDTISKV